jgi:membrane protein DedA with SNARE-associated domain
MLSDYLHKAAITVTNIVDLFGCTGIFFMTFIESTFIPIPSEITLIPAGYLIKQNQMNILPVIIAGLSGTLLGSLLNYTIAYKFGREVFIRYGKYFFLKEGQLEYLEQFFIKYGNVSTFIGRMLPGVKHFIAFPAGLARMDLKLFCIYTIAGSFVWLSVLLYFGYIIGNNEYLVTQYIKKFNVFIILTATIIAAYFFYKKSFKK